MSSDRERKKGPIDNGRGYLVNLVTLLLVGALLAGNLLALGLSFPSVLGNAGRTYKASTSGEMVLPFYPDGSTSCSLQAPSSVIEGSPFNVTLTFGSGSRPHPPQYIVLSSELGDLWYRLWDSWTADGSWSGWTRVPGLEGGFNWTVEAWSGREIGHSSKLSTFASVEVIKGRISFLLPLTDENLSLSHTSMFREVSRMVGGRGKMIYTLHERGGRSFTLDYDTLSYVPTSLWTEFDIECTFTHPTTSPLTRKYQKGFLVGTGWSPNHDADKVSMVLETVLDHKDSLYDLEKGASINNTQGNVTMMAETYYHISFTIPLDVTENSWFPLPDLTMKIEGKKYPLSPTPQRKVWKGIMVTPDDYGSDGRTDLIVEYDTIGTNSIELLRYRTYLTDNPTPDLSLSPDPFSDRYRDGLDPMELTLKGEWELVNWRLFRDVPQLELNDRDLELTEVTDGFEYNTTIVTTHQGTLGERTIRVRSATYFEPSETILLVLRLKGPVLIVWFLVISTAIVISCAYLFGRGLRPLLKGGAKDLERKIRDLLRDRDNDLIATSRTYIGALFFSLSVVVLFNLMEQPTPVPDLLSEKVPIWIRMVTLANASVWEEIITRVLMIGAPLSVLALMKQGKGPALKALIGGHGGVSVPAAVLIFISAALFGLAHIGWGIWKIAPTFIMGLLFGYLYVKIGLHASIALHFLFDYSSFLAELTGQQGPYLWTLLFFFSLFAGGVLLADLLTKIASWMEDRPHTGTGPVRVPTYAFLAAHSALALLFGAILIIDTGMAVLGVLMVMVPILDGIAFIVQRKTGGPVPKMLVYAASLITLPAAPLGMAWVIGKDQ